MIRGMMIAAGAATLFSLIGCGADDGMQRNPASSVPSLPNRAGTGAPGSAGMVANSMPSAGRGPLNTGLVSNATAGTPATAAPTAGRGPVATAGMAGPAPGSAGKPADVPVMTGGKEPRIPAKPADCPQLKTGMAMVLGQQVQLWVGTKQAEKKGAVMFYWHGTGSTSAEASGGLGSAIQEITADGGLVASFTTTTMKGQNTGNNVWYTGDFEMADQLLACAVDQLNIDTRRIYTGGCSAGGLQAGAMVYARSSYLAAAMPNSGGTTFPFQFDDPSHVPALITAHGKMGTDVVGIDFSQTSNSECTAIAQKGGFAVDCDHGGNHCSSPPALKAAQWTFLKAHPFGVMPEPYASGLPAGFPDYCKIIK